MAVASQNLPLLAVCLALLPNVRTEYKEYICPPTWTKCYRIQSENLKLKYVQAKSLCEADSVADQQARIIMPTEKHEMEYFRKLIEVHKNRDNKPPWIGMKYNGDKVVWDNPQQEPLADWIKCGNCHPHNGHCMSFRWADQPKHYDHVSCTNPSRKSFCERDTIDMTPVPGVKLENEWTCPMLWPKCWRMEKHKFRYEQANKQCKSLGARLPIIRTEDEWIYYKNKLSDIAGLTGSLRIYLGIIYDSSLNVFVWDTPDHESLPTWLKCSNCDGRTGKQIAIMSQKTDRDFRVEEDLLWSVMCETSIGRVLTTTTTTTKPTTTSKTTKSTTTKTTTTTSNQKTTIKTTQHVTGSNLTSVSSPGGSETNSDPPGMSATFIVLYICIGIASLVIVLQFIIAGMLFGSDDQAGEKKEASYSVLHPKSEDTSKSKTSK